MTVIDEKERERVLAQAVSDGKFTEGRVHVWRDAWNKNPDRTRREIEQLYPALARQPRMSHAVRAAFNLQPAGDRDQAARSQRETVRDLFSLKERS
jgi:hypothetical protein